MKNKPVLFPISIHYKGRAIQTKALKVSYLPQAVLYKVALPSEISLCNQCWLIREKTGWQRIIGQEIGEELTLTISSAILAFEQLKSTKRAIVPERNLLPA